MSAWFENAIFYSIYPLGAVNDKQRNDYEAPTENLVKLGDWVAHIRQMGCNAVYLGPLFESMSHGYDTTDYRRVDSRLGTNQQLTEFVRKCHDAGLRVVLDAVFNHTGRDFFAFRDILQNREGSRYRDWYEGLHFGGNNPLNDGFTYKAWRGHYELPTLNAHNPAVRDYLFESVRMWVRMFDIDGLRLDCADCLDLEFIRDLRQVCTGLKPDFWLMGEIIHGDYNRWINSKLLHSVTNYECAKGLYSSHNDGNLHEIAYSLNRQFGSGGIYRDLLLYNFADNHDVNRLADTVNRPEYLPTIYTLLYTMPGLPSLYYGSEWGIHGVTDRVTDWALRPQVDIRSMPFENPALVGHIAALARMRTTNRPLRHGGYEQLMVSSHQFAFRRELEGETVIVVINIADASTTVEISSGADALTDLFPEGEVFPVREGRADIPLPPFGSRVLRVGDMAKKGETAAPARKAEAPKPAAPKPTVEAAPAPPKPAKPSPRPAPKPKPIVPKEDGVKVVRRRDITPEHKHKHPAYEYFEYPVVAQGGESKSKVSFYELPPGKAADPYHYSTDREEVFYILEGSGTLRTPGGEQPVSTGDVLFFPASEKGAHKLTNTANAPLRYLHFATDDSQGLTYYPDSGKVAFRTGGERAPHIFRQADEAGYYDGE